VCRDLGAKFAKGLTVKQLREFKGPLVRNAQLYELIILKAECQAIAAAEPGRCQSLGLDADTQTGCDEEVRLFLALRKQTTREGVNKMIADSCAEAYKDAAACTQAVAAVVGGNLAKCPASGPVKSLCEAMIRHDPSHCEICEKKMERSSTELYGLALTLGLTDMARLGPARLQTLARAALLGYEPCDALDPVFLDECIKGASAAPVPYNPTPQK